MINYIYIVSSKNNQKENQYKLLGSKCIKETDKIGLCKIDYSNVEDYFILDKITCYEPINIIEKVEKSLKSTDRVFKVKYNILKKEILKYLIEDIEENDKEKDKETESLRKEMAKLRIILSTE